MGTYVMFTRLGHDALRTGTAPDELCRSVMDLVRKECPAVAWTVSYAVLGGPADYLDVFTAPDIDTAEKVSAIVRTVAHAQTEVWAATEWTTFVELMRGPRPATASV